MSVELLDVFGDDLTVVNAARVSFDKTSTELFPKDEKLIAYLAKHNHNSPFFHPQARFRLKMPLFIAREWFRHQIGFARNEVCEDMLTQIPSFGCLRNYESETKTKNKGQSRNKFSITGIA
jgi:thymidylate synthase (FAD)